LIHHPAADDFHPIPPFLLGLVQYSVDGVGHAEAGSSVDGFVPDRNRDPLDLVK
jgi:hypothetical protein